MSINFQNHEKDIVAKAKLKRCWVPGSDWEDVAQELRLHLWLKRDKFQPDKASERTFVNRVLENKIRDLQKTASRQKRHIDSFHLTFSQLELTESGQIALDLATPVI